MLKTRQLVYLFIYGVLSTGLWGYLAPFLVSHESYILPLAGGFCIFLWVIISYHMFCYLMMNIDEK
jgi:hypothetical protein